MIRHSTKRPVSKLVCSEKISGFSDLSVRQFAEDELTSSVSADGLSITLEEDIRQGISAFAENLNLSAVMAAVAERPAKLAPFEILYAQPSFTLSAEVLNDCTKHVFEAARRCKVSSEDFSIFEVNVSEDGYLNGCAIENSSSSAPTQKTAWKLYVVRCSMSSYRPFCLLLWSRHVLSASQKYCAEQQVRLMQAVYQLHQERLRSTQRISILEQAVHQIEHQLRTPLSLMEMYTDMLAYQSSSEAVKKPVQEIRKVLAEVGVSLKRLAACGLMTKRQPVACDLRLVMKESIAMLSPRIEQKQLFVLCDRQPLPLVVDRWQMQQVFHNLLNNAIAHSPQGGTIDCRWQVFQQEVLIEIRDQGPGLSSQDLKSIFKPFYSRREGGTGLGLSIARKVILDHQGTLWADNLPEGGAQFSIALPRTEKS